MGWNHPLNDMTRPKTGLSAAVAAGTVVSAKPMLSSPCINIFITLSLHGINGQGLCEPSVRRRLWRVSIKVNGLFKTSSTVKWILAERGNCTYWASGATSHQAGPLSPGKAIP
jgi:hypothetical protein